MALISQPAGFKTKLDASSPGLLTSPGRNGTQLRGRIRRKQGVIYNARPATEDVVDVATKPLTKQDLVSYLASGCKPKQQWR